MSAISENEFPHGVFFSPSSKDKQVVRASSLSASIPFSAWDGEKVAKPDEVFSESADSVGVICRSLQSLWNDRLRMA